FEEGGDVHGCVLPVVTATAIVPYGKRCRPGGVWREAAKPPLSGTSQVRRTARKGGRRCRRRAERVPWHDLRRRYGRCALPVAADGASARRLRPGLPRSAGFCA